MISPQEMLRKCQIRGQAMQAAKKRLVKVGLPLEKAGSQVYGDGQSIIEVGATYEYGSSDTPRRSFMRVPFKIKLKDISDFIGRQFRKCLEGSQPVEKGLNLIGIFAVNISKEAFNTEGFGTWPDIAQSTKDAKGSDLVLIDTGTLRNALTWAVVNK